jgi:hypothetical protein
MNAPMAQGESEMETHDEKLAGAIRRCNEMTASALHALVLSDAPRAAANLSCAAMFLADAIAYLTGDERGSREVHMAAHRAIEREFYNHLGVES